MRLPLAALTLALLTAGCGGGDERRAERAVAHAWVEAFNERSFDTACTLSLGGDDADCETFLTEAVPDGIEARVDGDRIVFDRVPEGTTISADAQSRDDGDPRVHVEVQTIR